jgi:hypothetical protein
MCSIDAFGRAARGPSNQLKRSVLNRMKWISTAKLKRNVNRAMSDLRGSNISQIFHMAISS